MEEDAHLSAKGVLILLANARNRLGRSLKEMRERGRERRETVRERRERGEESAIVKRKREERVHTPLPEEFSASSMPTTGAEGATPWKSKAENYRPTYTVSTKFYHSQRNYGKQDMERFIA